MSTQSENSDSDSNNSTSWVLLDDLKNGENQTKEKEEPEEDNREENEFAREAVEEIVENDSDGSFSVITDPEEANFEYTDSDVKEEVKKEPEQIVTYKKQEVVKIDSKPLISSSTLTSASFVIFGLLIALYFKDGFEDEVITDTNYKAYNPIKSKDFNDYDLKNVRDIEYIPDNYETGKKRKVFDERYLENQRDAYPKNQKSSNYKDMKKNYKGDKYGNNYKKKGEFKNYKEDKYEVDGNHIIKRNKGKQYESNDYKYDHERKLKEQGEYLNKKQHYLKNKEEKLKRKELKINLKNVYDTSKKFKNEKKFNKTFTGDWYNNLHNARQKIRKGEQEGDWMFGRAELRRKKRDKARWYFEIMDERETQRYKKNS